MPTLTRTYVGIAAQVRPISTFSSSMAFWNSPPGRFTSTIKKFACDPGTTVYPRLVRNSSVSDRLSALILRRKGTRSSSSSAACAAAALVIETLARLGAYGAIARNFWK